MITPKPELVDEVREATLNTWYVSIAFADNYPTHLYVAVYFDAALVEYLELFRRMHAKAYEEAHKIPTASPQYESTMTILMSAFAPNAAMTDTLHLRHEDNEKLNMHALHPIADRWLPMSFSAEEEMLEAAGMMTPEQVMRNLWRDAKRMYSSSVRLVVRSMSGSPPQLYFMSRFAGPGSRVNASNPEHKEVYEFETSSINLNFSTKRTAT
jgi:hypothetical protein